MVDSLTHRHSTLWLLALAISLRSATCFLLNGLDVPSRQLFALFLALSSARMFYGLFTRPTPMPRPSYALRKVLR